MKKILILTFSLTILFSLSLYGQKSKKSSAHGNSGKGRANLLLPFGNIGIGTLHPSAKLEVVGDARFNNHVFVEELQSIGLSVTSANITEDLTVDRNLLINGNVGIGVGNPSERLEINGNLRVVQNIFAESLGVNTLTSENGTFNQNLAVKQNLSVEGLTG